MSNSSLIIRIKHPKGEDGYKVFSIRVKNNILKSLDDISAKTGHSRNELINIFLEYAINNCEIVDQ